MKLGETKKMIDGVVYSIEDAKQIAIGTNLALESEPSSKELEYYAETKGEFVAEALYEASNGKYFIYGMGGDCSDYTENYVGGKGAGCDIWLIDEDGIAQWMERYNLADDYEKFFNK